MGLVNFMLQHPWLTIIAIVLIGGSYIYILYIYFEDN